MKSRISNLKAEEIKRCRSGDLLYLRKLLESEYEMVKEDLVHFPLDQVERLRGRASAIADIINLLPQR